MQKFVLTFLFLGLLAMMFYHPVPMDKLEAGLDDGSLLYQPNKKAPKAPNELYQASVEQVSSPDFDPNIDLSKKNKKNYECDALLTFSNVKH